MKSQKAVNFVGCRTETFTRFGIYIVLTAHFIFHLAIYKFLPDDNPQIIPRYKGLTSYKFTGQSTVVLSIIECIIITFYFRSALFESLLPIWLFTCIFCIIFTIYITKPGNFQDFWLGTKSNPMMFSINWKLFLELRPGLVLWLLINCSALWFISVHRSLMLSEIILFLTQGLYVLDAIFCEPAIVTTMDIQSEKLGFMLVFGDLGWLPFLYSAQLTSHAASVRMDIYGEDIFYDFYDSNSFISSIVDSIRRYSLTHIIFNETYVAIIGLILCLTGYLIFRIANLQKHFFRCGQYKSAITLKTDTGKELLLSGLWSLGRKINYTGDLLLALGWGLLGNNMISFIYPVFLFCLLINRVNRDRDICSKKYKKYWDKYEELVPWIFFKGIY